MRPTILLVEDNPDHAELFQRAFDQHAAGFHLEIAHSLAAARRRLTQARPTLIVTDLELPDGQGLTLIEEARGLQIPVMILTSRGDETAAVRALKFGAVDYVVKPSDTFADLPHRAESVLREWETQQKCRRLEWELRELFEQSHSLLCIINRAGQLCRINPAVSRILGWKQAELEKLPYTTLIHPDDQVRVRDWFDQRWAGIGPAEFTIRCLTIDGGTRYLEWTAVSGADQTLFTSALDITERLEQARLQREREVALAKLSVLTDRERQVVHRVVDGLPNKAIAAQLSLNEKTVEKHRSSVMRKLKCHNLPALVKFVVFAEDSCVPGGTWGNGLAPQDPDSAKLPGTGDYVAAESTTMVRRR